MPWTNASIVLNSRDATGGIKQNGNLYNSLLFNAVGQNIIQGQVESISVSEVNFAYDIPNIQTGFNYFEIEFASQPPQSENTLEVTVPPGFYTGVELETAVNGAIALANTNIPEPFADAQLPVLSYDVTSNTFIFTEGESVGSSCLIFSPYTFWNVPPSPATRNLLGKDIMSIMGYAQNLGAGYATSASSNPLVVDGEGNTRSGSAPLAFTQYIDICSPQLCKFQYFRDGTTTNLARRNDVICRLYIANNQATQEDEGQRPFIINRQFQNARVMRWTADNAVGTIDINLFDDVGQPLTTTWLPRPYQITFNCYETPKEEM
jgi:hypothetical protein